MKLLIINNLSSGYGDGAIYDFIRSFNRSGDEVCLRTIDSSSNFQNALQDADSFDAVVASGGDGTVASICYLLRNVDVPILPFPAGTSNLLALNLMSPNEPHALAKMAREGKVLPFDMGEITVNGESHGFTIMAGCGYDATIMQDAKATKKLLGPLAYFQAAVANPLPQKSEFTLNIDGQEIHTQGVGVLVANFSKIQFDISVAERNRPRDGALDVIVLSSSTALELIPSVLAAAIDHSGAAIVNSDVLQLYCGKHISVDASPSMHVQFDGETLESHTPFTAQILRQAARLIVSDEAYDLFSGE